MLVTKSDNLNLILRFHIRLKRRESTSMKSPGVDKYTSGHACNYTHTYPYIHPHPHTHTCNFKEVGNRLSFFSIEVGPRHPDSLSVRLTMCSKLTSLSTEKWLRDSFALLAEDWASVPSTYIKWFTDICKSSSKGSTALRWPLWDLHTCDELKYMQAK